jgi:hypothetical protein
MADCEIANCGICCPGGCFCMDTGIGGCECWCDAVMRFTKPRGIEGAVDPEMYVDFTATDMSLARLAAWFDFLFPSQILIPASSVYKQVTTGKLQQIKIGELVEKIGLVPVKKPLVGRDFTNFKFG